MATIDTEQKARIALDLARKALFETAQERPGWNTERQVFQLSELAHDGQLLTDAAPGFLNALDAALGG